MPPWARGAPQYKKKWSKKVPPPKGGYGLGKPSGGGRRRPLPTPMPAVPPGVPTARLKITKITTSTVASPTPHEIEEAEMMRLAEMALKVESKRDQVQKFREQIQSLQNRDDEVEEEEEEDDQGSDFI